MIYKLGKLLTVYNTEKNRRVEMFKVSSGYRIVLFVKKLNHWQINKTRQTTFKKYAERRFIELCFELNQNQE